MLDPVSDATSDVWLSVRFAVTATGYAFAAWACYLAGRRLDDSESASGRALAALVTAGFLATAGFYVLAYLGWFRFWIVSPAGVVLGIAAHRLLDGARARATLQGDLRTAREALRKGLKGPTGLLVAGIGLLLLVLLARGLAMPPLSWDSLTYHLLKAGRWVQTGGFAPEEAPDAWGYYEYYPLGGDIPWAWLMLPTRTDQLLSFGGLGYGVLILLGTYRLGRELEGERRASAIAALCVLLTPTVTAQLVTGYVDNNVLGLFAAGTALLTRATRQRSRSSALLAAAAFGQLAATKISMVPIAAVALPILLVSGWQLGAGRGRFVAGLVLGLSVALPAPLRTLIEQGSPTYPFELTVFGHTLFHGNSQMVALLRGDLFPTEYLINESLLWWHLFFGAPEANTQHLNLGPGAIAFIVIGLGGFVAAARLHRFRNQLLFFGFVVLVMAVGLYSDSMRSQRIWFAATAGRFLTPAVMLLTVFAWRVQLLPVRGILWVAAIVQGYYSLPHGLGEPDMLGALGVALLLSLAGAAIMVVVRLHHRVGMTVRLGVVLVTITAFMQAQMMLREAVRAPVFARSVGLDPIYQWHPLPALFVQWNIWNIVDDGAPHRIAYVAGWGNFGLNWFRYPLLGSRLQNELIYVSPIRDKSVVDYRMMDELEPLADYRAWLRRIRDLAVDIVVFGPPPPPELGWVIASGSAFRNPVRGPFGEAYAVDPEALDALLVRTEALAPWFGVPLTAFEKPQWRPFR